MWGENSGECILYVSGLPPGVIQSHGDGDGGGETRATYTPAVKGSTGQTGQTFGFNVVESKRYVRRNDGCGGWNEHIEDGIRKW